MGTDIFTWHGYTEVHVDGAWRKATPTFNATLCAKVGVHPLISTATATRCCIPSTAAGRTYMQYVRDHGLYYDVPRQIPDARDGARLRQHAARTDLVGNCDVRGESARGEPGDARNSPGRAVKGLLASDEREGESFAS